MEKGLKIRKQLENTILCKVGDVISAIKDAKNVDQVICAIHSLAVMLFPIDSSALSGSIDEGYRHQLVCTNVSPEERSDWWEVFYRGAAFPILSRVLLYDIVSTWLACFPISAQKYVYDVFFVNGLSTEVVQAVVPCLASNSPDAKAVHSNAERLLVLCLIENNGVLYMAQEFGVSLQSEYLTGEQLKPAIHRAAQLVASIPDKARSRAPTSLSSHVFFKQITVQLLAGAEQRDTEFSDKLAILDRSNMDGSFLFVGETFARICRRGSADVILREMMPRILRHVRSFLSSNISNVADLFVSSPGSKVWLNMMEAIKDSYAVERLSEQILHELATDHASDDEAYWTLWILFHRIFHDQTSVRSLFVDKFLLWKVFPICCLRWILQFAVLECPPKVGALTRDHQNSCGFIDTVQRLAAVWSKLEFVQSASMEQQVYVTAALGLSLEKMSKEELDATKDVMHCILRGVSCRLENPSDLIRRMGSCVALVFSKVVDPKNPLYLDDNCRGDIVDWEFGLTTPGKKTPRASVLDKDTIDKIGTSTNLVPEKEVNSIAVSDKHVTGRSKKLTEFKLVDPDEIIDPALLNNEPVSDDDDNDNASENSESSSNSSLQPYDLSDDDTDLKKNLSQLVDVVGALRKSDDADGVERALDVAEKLVRASPDELSHVAGDLARTLMQVRCSELTVEGEEESAEEKRQKALVALVVTCPFESLDTLNKLLYSPHVDTSQRILLLDVMTDAADELAAAKTMKLKNLQQPLISTTSETQPWFFPSSIGPPGAGQWKEISETSSLLNYSYRYERELPSKPAQVKRGKTRRWSLRSTNMQENFTEWSQNKFPLYAAEFMLPAMQGFDKRRHGVDLLGRDFIVLGKLVHMLGVCIKCAAMHPEASALASPLLNMLSSRNICHHKEAYVRRSVLFAASCILVALHPSYVASTLIEGNPEISEGLEWVRTWALHVVDSDPDRECYMMAMRCLQLHTEMALQASRALESAESPFKAKGVGLPSDLSKRTIKIPFTNIEY